MPASSSRLFMGSVMPASARPCNPLPVTPGSFTSLKTKKSPRADVPWGTARRRGELTPHFLSGFGRGMEAGEGGGFSTACLSGVSATRGGFGERLGGGAAARQLHVLHAVGLGVVLPRAG